MQVLFGVESRVTNPEMPSWDETHWCPGQLYPKVWSPSFVGAPGGPKFSIRLGDLSIPMLVLAGPQRKRIVGDVGSESQHL